MPLNESPNHSPLTQTTAPDSRLPTQFINIVTECKGKHRTAIYCDQAIARAQQLAKHTPPDL